jgi:hypothetical protein
MYTFFKRRMGDENSEKTLFRLRHIVPRNLVSSFYPSHSASSEKAKVVRYQNPDGSEEIEFQLTWGKFAGNLAIDLSQCLFVRVVNYCFSTLDS